MVRRILLPLTFLIPTIISIPIPHPNQATIGFTTLSVPLTGDRNPSQKGNMFCRLRQCRQILPKLILSAILLR